MGEEHSAVDSSNSLGGGTVHVIATSLEGTREALEAATTLARGLSARVVVFVRRAAPSMHSLPEDRDQTAEAALKRLTNSYTPRPNVLSCVCEQTVDIVQLFQPPGLVVIGGETRWWWPTAEQRLARALTRFGCHVTFVHVPRSEFVSPLVTTSRAPALQAYRHEENRGSER
jgi:hypothetical protein